MKAIRYIWFGSMTAFILIAISLTQHDHLLAALLTTFIPVTMFCLSLWAERRANA